MAFESRTDLRWEASDTKAVDTDWFDNDISVRAGMTDMHILQMMVPSSTIVNVQLKNGGTTKVFNLNAGTALTANAGYQFALILGPGDSYNVQHKTGTQNVACSAFLVDAVRL